MSNPVINIYTLTSPIHNEKEIEGATQQWLGAIEAVIGEGILHNCADDYSTYGNADLSIIYIRTGGTESLFKQLYENNTLIKQKTVLLLTSGKSNSLAASMEILSWLRTQEADGEILHGTAEYVAQKIMRLAKVSIAFRELNGKKIGIIGKPSDWLIASYYDTNTIRNKLGIETEEIEMQELLTEIHKHDYPIDARKRLQTCPSDFFIGALEIYGALKRIVTRHNLNALTLRCFDLLSSVHNTGCLALALLNQEGIPSGCEGDVPALITMMISQALTGETGFQANPSRIDPNKGEFVFAHCTIPLNMVTSYEYDTHFESGIGVAIRGKMPLGTVTLAKFSGDLQRFYFAQGQLLENLQEKQLCRTQIKVSLPDSAAYFLKRPIGNHHIILRGAQQELFEEFVNALIINETLPQTT